MYLDQPSVPEATPKDRQPPNTPTAYVMTCAAPRNKIDESNGAVFRKTSKQRPTRGGEASGRDDSGLQRGSGGRGGRIQAKEGENGTTSTTCPPAETSNNAMPSPNPPQSSKAPTISQQNEQEQGQKNPSSAGGPRRLVRQRPKSANAVMSSVSTMNRKVPDFGFLAAPTAVSGEELKEGRKNDGRVCESRPDSGKRYTREHEVHTCWGADKPRTRRPTPLGKSNTPKTSEEVSLCTVNSCEQHDTPDT